jgi:Natural resistance-associated macrophage protein
MVREFAFAHLFALIHATLVIQLMPSNNVPAPPSLEKRPLRRLFSNLGPGLITGAADDDPSGISTYSVAGATFGYLPLWTALFSFPLMTAVQLMCARLGLVTVLDRVENQVPVTARALDGAGASSTR